MDDEVNFEACYELGWADGRFPLEWWGFCEEGDFEFPEQYVAYKMGLEDRRESMR